MNVVNVKNTAEPITPVEKIGGCKTAGELLAALGGGQLRTTAGVRILGEYPLESIQDLDWTPPASASPGAGAGAAGGGGALELLTLDQPGVVQSSAQAGLFTQVEHIGMLEEGLYARQRLFFTERADTVTAMLTLVKTLGAVLIKGPPQTGKTSLLQLIGKFAKDCPLDFESVTHMSMLGTLTFDQRLDHCSSSLRNACCSPPSSDSGFAGRKHLLLVDEAQQIYGDTSSTLWSAIKRASQGGNSRLLIIIAAVYSCTPSGVRPNLPETSPLHTPFGFTSAAQVSLAPSGNRLSSKAGDPDIITPSLALSKQEYGELLCAFNAYLRTRWEKVACSATDEPALSSDELINILFQVTAGQVGLITSVLDILLDKVKREDGRILKLNEIAWHVLRTRDLHDALRGVRNIMDMDSIQEYEDVLDAVFYGRRCDGAMEKKANRLMRRGLLMLPDTGETTMFQFVSPLHRHYYLQQLYGAKLSTLIDCSNDFGMFLENTIRRMDPNTLKGSLSKGLDDRLYERHYQMEFYRSAVSFLPKDVLVAPDVGTVFGAGGVVDFWVSRAEPKLAWAIELLRDGDRAQEHADRFMEPGRYHNLPMTKYCLVDFRTGPAKMDIRQDFWHVVFSKDYTSAQIITTSSEKIVKLCALPLSSAWS